MRRESDVSASKEIRQPVNLLEVRRYGRHTTGPPGFPPVMGRGEQLRLLSQGLTILPVLPFPPCTC